MRTITTYTSLSVYVLRGEPEGKRDIIMYIIHVGRERCPCTVMKLSLAAAVYPAGVIRAGEGII